MVFGITLICLEAPRTFWNCLFLLYSCLVLHSASTTILCTCICRTSMNIFYASILYSCLPKLFISHIVFSASSLLTKILSMIYSTLSLMRPIFNNCSAHQILGLYFLEPSAINLRQILSFFTHSFQSAFFKSCKHPFEPLYPKMTLLDKPRRKKKTHFLSLCTY